MRRFEDTATDADTPLDVEETPEPQPAWDTRRTRLGHGATFEDTATDADTPLDVEETPEPQPAWDTVHAFEDTATDADTPRGRRGPR